MARTSHVAAARALAERDPVIAGLVEAVGPPRLRAPHETSFEALVRAIVYQQLAGAAASTIHGRLLALLHDDVEPGTVLAQTEEALRGVGLSGNKMASIRDLATKVLDGTVVLDPRGIARESDDEVVARLTAVRGIGRWTAEMFLIFQLRRLDVAHRRSRGAQGVRARPRDRDADAQGARGARRRLPALPVGGGVVLLAGQRGVRVGQAHAGHVLSARSAAPETTRPGPIGPDHAARGPTMARRWPHRSRATTSPMSPDWHAST
jgi:DNA-3-methyladenine glycosylase II